MQAEPISLNLTSRNRHQRTRYELGGVARKEKGQLEDGRAVNREIEQG